MEKKPKLTDENISKMIIDMTILIIGLEERVQELENKLNNICKCQ